MSKSKTRQVSVRADALKPHPSAQRDISPTHLRRLVRDFDLDALGTIHIVQINEEYLIVDGQHRWAALIELGFGEWRMRCILHEDVTDIARASDLFLKLNQKATVLVEAKFKNMLTAGYPVAVGAKAVAERHGYKVTPKYGDGNITCFGTLMRLYALDDGVTLDETLGVLDEAFGKSAVAVEGKLVEGLGIHVIGRFNGQIDRAALVKKLAKCNGGANGLIGAGRARREWSHGSLPKCIGSAIVDLYNSGRRDPNKLPV